MSGIVGILNLDGAPVDRQLLGRMTEFMSFRGPDAQEIWIDGHVGFGHTMLRTTFEAETEKQPLTLDGKVWLTADARIDGRDDLISKLEAKIRTKLRIPQRSNGNGSDTRIPNDAELILYAYQAWGEDCVKHLIGDFAFAIWDGRERKLFCARDHFGVKPFYYAQVGDIYIFSNTLNSVRLHPALSDDLNDRFIGDFLLFHMCRDPSITAFNDIKRLPPAHFHTWSTGSPQLKRYWTLPTNDTVRYRRATDYIDNFNDLLLKAVDDRLRTERVGVFMSGGLDSTTAATAAHELLSKRTGSFDLRAYTAVYDRLFADEERYYSGLVADKLGIPIHYLVADDYELYEGFERPELRTPEPSHEPLGLISLDQTRQVVRHSRIVLTGYGLDPAITPSHSYGIDMVKALRFVRLAKDVGWFVFSSHQLPRLGFRGWIKGCFGKQTSARYPEYPSWLNQSFATRAKLPERWKEINEQTAPAFSTRPQSYRSLAGPFWPARFESDDPGLTSITCENRHPFFDLRLMTYLLALPAVPWCVGKELIRRAMRGRLPEQVRLRPKTVLAGDPILLRQRRENLRWMDEFVATPELNEYIVRHSVPQVASEKQSDKLWVNTRPLSLNLWLKGFRSQPRQLEAVACYETAG